MSDHPADLNFSWPETRFTAGELRDAARAGWHARDGDLKLAEICAQAAQEELSKLLAAARRAARFPRYKKKRQEAPPLVALQEIDRVVATLEGAEAQGEARSKLTLLAVQLADEPEMAVEMIANLGERYAERGWTKTEPAA